MRHPLLRSDRGGWWIGACFAVGSILFLVPSLAALNSSPDWIGPTFFVGSIFFTTAGLLQFLLARRVPHARRPAGEREPLTPRAWMPNYIEWFSAAVQLVGTVLFNVNTYAAMQDQLSTRATNVHVWAPDFVGSGCFLLASLMAFANTEHEWVSWRPRDLDWLIAAVNLLGSIAFGVSAVAAYIRPATGSAVSDTVANAGTAAGALCFLIGAILLPLQVERQERAVASAA